MRLPALTSHLALVTTIAAATLVAPSALVNRANAATAVPSSTYVRVMHAVPGMGTANVYLDGQLTIAQLAYSTATPFIAMPAGKHHIQVSSCGGGTAGAGGSTAGSAGAVGSTGAGANGCANTGAAGTSGSSGTSGGASNNGGANTVNACANKSNTSGSGTGGSGNTGGSGTAGNAGRGGCVLDVTLSFAAGQYFTLALAGSGTANSATGNAGQGGGLPSSGKTGANANTGVQAKLFTNLSTASVTRGKAMVRVVNLSPDEPAVDISVTGGATVFSKISFPNASRYMAMTPGTYTFAAYPSTPTQTSNGTSGNNSGNSNSGQAMVVAVPNATLAAGHVYSLLILGMANTSGSNGNNAGGNSYAPQHLNAIIVDTTPAPIVMLPTL